MLLAALIAVAVTAIWVRDSPLVRVRHVTITGLSGPEAPQISQALEDAARSMTTLHVRAGALRAAAAPYSVVAGISVGTQFPHGLTVAVRQRTPVGVVTAAGQRIVVAADGTVLSGIPAAGLPIVAAHAMPAGREVTDPRTRHLVALLAAAPPALRADVRRVFLGPRGLTAPLRNGPTLYFGGSERLHAKWISATRVLGDPGSRGATYLDVRLPERPVAGGLDQPLTDPSQSTQTTALPGAATMTP
jgi:cell division protein FtsQ